MRFLCLHGMGTNQDILSIQLSGLKAQLGDEHEFVFMEGEIDTVAGPGVAEFFPGPYLCYYELPTPEQVREAQDMVLETVAEEGPFDGIVGFSQGAALASSVMLRQKFLDPSRDLFQMAIFLCASLPFDLDASPKALSRDMLDEMVACGYSGDAADETQLCQRYRPSNKDAPRLDVPTIHIVGKSDGYHDQGLKLAELAGPKAVLLTHDGGHDVPKSREFSQKFAQEVEKVCAQVQLRT